VFHKPTSIQCSPHQGTRYLCFIRKSQPANGEAGRELKKVNNPTLALPFKDTRGGNNNSQLLSLLRGWLGGSKKLTTPP